jgi:hypothetical protein
MKLPIDHPQLLPVLAVIFGMIFGLLLHRGRVTDYNVIVNQFRLRDFTVIKVMLTAVLVGGIGVLVLQRLGLAQYHVKAADMFAVSLGAAIFGVGMAIYGYCPGTGVAAVATGSLHALVGFLGMLVGGVLYAISFTWVQQHVAPVAALGKIRLPDITGIPDWIWFGGILLVALPTVWLIRRADREAAPPENPAQASGTEPNRQLADVGSSAGSKT